MRIKTNNQKKKCFFSYSEGLQISLKEYEYVKYFLCFDAGKGTDLGEKR